MNKDDQKIITRYNRVAKIYDPMESLMEKMGLDKWRRELWQQTHGNILEVGVGTGRNIPYYPLDAEIIAIDFSEKMLEKAKEKAEVYGRKIDLRLMDVQNLEFPSDMFDTVITTCVFCSVPNPVKGLMEIKRVCKKDGRIIMLEHVRSRHPILGLLMDLFNPITVRMIGANINRNTVENLKKAGIRVDVEEDLMMDIVKHLQCSKS
jgi:ubiquinone/menaquinone biosynthesis C-methylase UbiE